MGLIKIPKKSVKYFKENVEEIFDSGNLAEGPWNKKLSNYIKELTHSPISIPTNSNGAGLVTLMSIYRHYYGRTNVMIQSNTMYGVKAMIGAAGCRQVGFIECQINTLMPSISDVNKSIGGLKKEEKSNLIILLSHIGGIVNPDINLIEQLCKNENIILLEDCAHSFGATLSNKHSGLFGDAGVYSFYATKAIPVGEGGIIVSNDKEIGEMASSFSIYDRFDQKLEIGNNIRISEVQALLAYSVISEWKRIIRNKQKIANKYIEACQSSGINYISQNTNGQNGNYYKFIIYSIDNPVQQSFPRLKIKTSAVYDYSIGIKNNVANFHFCLPIWYGQESDIADQVISQLI